MELQQSAAGADPEQVLVIETVGSVDNFANAVKHIEGLEWMGEIETDEIAPDGDFYNEAKPTKELSGRLYMVMSNQRALDEMLSLWQRYQDDPNLDFRDRHSELWGLAKFRDVFLCLRDIRRWSVQDRIEETGVLDAWREDLEHDGNRAIRFEIELWFRGADNTRQEAQRQVQTLIEELGGSMIGTCIIPDIAYHALLAEIPANTAQQIIDRPEVDLIKCDSVIFFRPVGQMVTGKAPIEAELLDHEAEAAALPAGDPVVAILDGLPLANHRLLQDRLIIDDPDDYTSAYTVVDRIHGTNIASLVCRGDLNDNDSPLTRPVYVRPIMKPIQWIDSPRPEQVPDDALVVDHIHRAVRRIFEGEGTADPAAPTVRIINFSIGDPYRQFSQVLSPLARLLDWLSIKYGALFVISAGNHLDDIDMGISKDEFDALSEEEKEALVVRTIYSDARNRKIFSPAESINGLTVGALHYDSAGVPHMGRALNFFVSLLPSPVSAFGSGHRRAVKPDLIFSGGRVLHQEPFSQNADATFKTRQMRVAPGNKVASPSGIAGELGKVAFCCGTSNAAALISRLSAVCHDTLQDVFEEQAPDISLRPYLAPLLKTMVIHGCSWGGIEDRLREILQTADNGRQIKSLISRWLGYGVPDTDRVMDCTEQRATLLGFGHLEDEEAHIFTLPLPTSLGARREWRRLTATLAWMSPVAASTQKYRAAGLWFELDGSPIAAGRSEVDTRASRRGTVQHEVFEGDRAVAISEDSTLTIKVNCRKDAAKIQFPVPYGLAVTLEVAEGIDIAIYEEIRMRIAPAVGIRAREQR
ncbi:MAG: S8 family peptidase [Wenzhouxiangellaceae bacterium]